MTDAAQPKSNVRKILYVIAVKRIDALFDIERNINDLSAEERLLVCQERSAPILAALEAWLREERSRLSRSASVAKPADAGRTSRTGSWPEGLVRRSPAA